MVHPRPPAQGIKHGSMGRLLAGATAALLLAAPASAFEPRDDPAEFDYLVPLEEDQAFTVQQMYRMEEVDGIIRHVSQLAKADPENPEAWKVLCQWIYLKWRKLEDRDAQLRAIRIGKAAAERLARTAPDSSEAHVFRSMMPALEALSKGILDSLHAAPKIRDNARTLVADQVSYFHSYGYWTLGRLYYKLPGFPVSFGDLKKSEALLEEAWAREKGFAVIPLFLAETKAALGEMEAFHELLDRIPDLEYRTYFAKYAHWVVVHEAEALREVVTSGEYNKYTWDPLLVEYPPPPPDW